MGRKVKWVGVILLLFVFVSKVIGEEEKKEGILISSNKVENYTLEKGKEQVIFNIENSYDSAYLWILGHGLDKRRIEHGACQIKIEVNGVILSPERMVFQGMTYKYPVQPVSYMRNIYKYNEITQSWSFKYDVDFIMNNNTGKAGNWGVYTTTGYNHWYAFDLKGIAKKGKNEVIITECVQSGQWKKGYYDGFMIGEISFCSIEELKEKIAQYEEKQIKINPEELVLKKEASIPEGKIQKVEIKDGYIIKDGKPYLHLHVQGHSNYENACQNMLYFNWANDVQAPNGAVTEVAYYPDYLTSNWETQNFLATNALNHFSKTYTFDMLSDLYYTDFNVNLSPAEEVIKRIPDFYAIDSRGKICEVMDHGKYFPNLGSDLYKEYIRQVIALLSKKLKNHPGLFANISYEELIWRCYNTYLPPQDDISKEKYRTFLLNKYKTIDVLNKEWQTEYKSFSEIQPPKTMEQSANFLNFQIFRSKIIEEYAKNMYLSLKEFFPDRPVTGERSGSEFDHWGWGSGENRFSLIKWADIRTIGMEQVAFVRAERRAGNKDAVLQNDICFACQYKYIKRPYKPFWGLPNSKDERGIEITTNTFFNKIIKDYFEGVRSSFYYSYDDDRHHLIHNQKLYSQGRISEKISSWEIDLWEELKGLPDIVIPEHSKGVTKANGIAYKIAPLLLPSKLDKGKVALLYTRKSSLIGFTFDKSLQGNEGGVIPASEWSYIQTLLEHLHIPFEVITDDLIGEINDYNILICGYFATVGDERIAEEIKRFIKRGGVVVFYPEVFTYDGKTLKNSSYSPGYGLDEIFGCRIKKKISGEKKVEVEITKDISEELKKGDIFTVRGLVTPLEVLEKGEVIAKLKDTGDPIIVRSNSGRTYYLGFAVGCSYSTSVPYDNKIRGLFDAIMKKAESPILVEGENKHYIYVRHLKGDDYYLLTALNNSSEKKDIKLKLNFLPRGKYQIIDITEEGSPNVILSSANIVDLKEKGIEIELPALCGRIFLIRDMNKEVYIDCPEYTLKSLIDKEAITLVVPEPASKAIIEKTNLIKKYLEKKGVEVIINSPTIKDTFYTAKEQGIKFAEFQNKIIDTQNNLILIGNVETNKIIKHLSDGNYTYDKLLEDVDTKYPGSGKGVIQISESVNKPYYCPTDKSRDAIIISGSDEKGLIKALNQFIKIVF